MGKHWLLVLMGSLPTEVILKKLANLSEFWFPPLSNEETEQEQLLPTWLLLFFKSDLVLAELDPHCWTWAFSSWREWGLLSSYLWDLLGPGIEPPPLDHQGSPQINLLMNSWQWWWVGREHLLKLRVRKLVFWCLWLLSEFLSHVVVVCERVLSAFIDRVTFFPPLFLIVCWRRREWQRMRWMALPTHWT